MLQLQYKSYKQSVSIEELSTNLDLIITYIYNHLQLYNNISNSRFQRYPIDNYKLQCF